MHSCRRKRARKGEKRLLKRNEIAARRIWMLCRIKSKECEEDPGWQRKGARTTPGIWRDFHKSHRQMTDAFVTR